MNEHLPFQVFSRVYDSLTSSDPNEPKIKISCLFKSGKFHVTVKQGQDILREAIRAKAPPVHCNVSDQDIEEIDIVSDRLLSLLLKPAGAMAMA